jgi:hypothetical protein
MSLDPETTGPTLDDVVVTGPGSSAVPEIPGSGLTLAPPSPNPASGGVWLNFEVPEASPVRLSVCDIQGREIHLIAEGLLAGRQSRYWDGTTARGRMPAGLYLIRLATPAATLVRKVLLTH